MPTDEKEKKKSPAKRKLSKKATIELPPGGIEAFSTMVPVEDVNQQQKLYDKEIQNYKKVAYDISEDKVTKKSAALMRELKLLPEDPVAEEKGKKKKKKGKAEKS